MTVAAGQGIISTPCNHSVDQTVEKLKGILKAKGVTLFALIDHSGEAEKVGMKMPPTKLLIFGSPKAGTHLMLAVPVFRNLLVADVVSDAGAFMQNVGAAWLMVSRDAGPIYAVQSAPPKP